MLDDLRPVLRHRDNIAIVGHRVAREHQFAAITGDGEWDDANEAWPGVDNEEVRLVRSVVATIPGNAPAG
jgi:hypothetical protein